MEIPGASARRFLSNLTCCISYFWSGGFLRRMIHFCIKQLLFTWEGEPIWPVKKTDSKPNLRYGISLLIHKAHKVFMYLPIQARKLEEIFFCKPFVNHLHARERWNAAHLVLGGTQPWPALPIRTGTSVGLLGSPLFILDGAQAWDGDLVVEKGLPSNLVVQTPTWVAGYAV